MAKKKVYKVLHWIDTGIFPATVMFTCGFKYDDIIKMLKKKKAEHWHTGLGNDKELIDNGNYFALRRDIENSKTRKSKTLFYIIITEDFNFTDYEYCKLAHEVLHICQFFLPDCLDRNKEHEAEAYLHTHLMLQCLKVLRGNKN
jgi:hypothetical protein